MRLEIPVIEISTGSGEDQFARAQSLKVSWHRVHSNLTNFVKSDKIHGPQITTNLSRVSWMTLGYFLYGQGCGIMK